MEVGSHAELPAKSSTPGHDRSRVQGAEHEPFSVRQTGGSESSTTSPDARSSDNFLTVPVIRWCGRDESRDIKHGR